MFFRANLLGTTLNVFSPSILGWFVAAITVCLLATFIPLGIALRRLEATELS